MHHPFILAVMDRTKWEDRLHPSYELETGQIAASLYEASQFGEINGGKRRKRYSQLEQNRIRRKARESINAYQNFMPERDKSE